MIFTLKTPFLPRDMVFYWVRQKYMNYHEPPFWPDYCLRAFQRCMIPCLTEFCLHMVWRMMKLMFCFIIGIRNGARVMNWTFDWIKPCLQEVNAFWCDDLLSVLHEIFPILSIFDFPHECYCWGHVVKHHMKLRWEMNRLLI